MSETMAAHTDSVDMTTKTIKPNNLFTNIPDRYVMVFLCALCTCINYADRVNMSVCIISMAETYNFTLRQQSIVMSSFFVGYVPMQLTGALLCRRFGGKIVLQYGALMWSLLTIATPLAADINLACLLACRVCMGLAEGVAFPGVFHFLSSWIPSAERGRSIALFLTGAHVGTVAALVISPVIIRTMHWRFVFYIFGCVGFVWIAAWKLLAYDRDALYRRSESDVRVRDAHDADGSDEQSVTVPLAADGEAGSTKPEAQVRSYWNVFTMEEWRVVKTVLRDRRTLSVSGAQSIFALIHYIILSWLPTYFKNVYNVETGSLSFTFAPYAAMAIAASAGGIGADSLIRKGWHATHVRKAVTIVASSGAAVSLIIFSRMPDVVSAIIVVSVSMAFMSLHSGGFETAYLDVASPSGTGLLKAVANTMGSFAGLFAIPFATLVLDWVNGSWRLMFATLAIWHVILAIVFCLFYSAERVLTEDGR